MNYKPLTDVPHNAHRDDFIFRLNDASVDVCIVADIHWIGEGTDRTLVMFMPTAIQICGECEVYLKWRTLDRLEQLQTRNLLAAQIRKGEWLDDIDRQCDEQAASDRYPVAEKA